MVKAELPEFKILLCLKNPALDNRSLCFQDFCPCGASILPVLEFRAKTLSLCQLSPDTTFKLLLRVPSGKRRSVGTRKHGEKQTLGLP